MLEESVRTTRTLSAGIGALLWNPHSGVWQFEINRLNPHEIMPMIGFSFKGLAR